MYITVIVSYVCFSVMTFFNLNRLVLSLVSSSKGHWLIYYVLASYESVKTYSLRTKSGTSCSLIAVKTNH